MKPRIVFQQRNYLPAISEASESVEQTPMNNIVYRTGFDNPNQTEEYLQA